MTSPVIGTPWKKLSEPVSDEKLEGVDKYWRAANYLSIGQIYLRDNPLMKEPFTREDVKHRLVGHWGTTPGLNFLIGHINRLIADHQQNTVIIMGPGHGGPAGTAQSYLDGTYTEYFPEITKDEAGLQKFFRQFSYPGGIPSHYAPETPGSIHEGGELGYALSHAYGAIMNNPSLFVPAIVGDGEAETGPLATGWQSNKLVNPRTDGIVLPIIDAHKEKFYAKAFFNGREIIPCDDWDLLVLEEKTQEALDGLCADENLSDAQKAAADKILVCGLEAKTFAASCKESQAFVDKKITVSRGRLVSVESLFALAEEKISKGLSPLADYDGPQYFRASEAEQRQQN